MLWQNVSAGFGVHGEVSMVQDSEREGFAEEHSQAKLRDVLVPPWTSCFSELSPLS